MTDNRTGARAARVYMVRHGQTTSNVMHALDTELPGASLTELGEQQARRAGEELARVVGGGAVLDESERAEESVNERESAGAREGVERSVRLASSEADRARQTAAHIATALDDAGVTIASHQVLPGISEIPAGELEMLTDESSHAEYHMSFGAWLMGDVQRPVRGALNGYQVLERYLPSLFAFLAEREGLDVVVVSHGAVIRFVTAFLGNINADFAFSTYVANTQWVEMELPSREVLLGLASKARELSADDAGGFEAFRGCMTVTSWAGHVPVRA
ncbi:histidine phosphatase family protein [Corynebacterium sp. 320]|uniref:histidine phosphatase family protein n=1 Tax=Corynebacterium TaxID=1716 RepID=UPI00125CA9CA|nr:MULTISPECIES: histidine phosphatase family protein [Corynebacterium]KAB1504348.1 histidine phosphatase family protein [Corynebacterium sp. 320]KAB1552552.1 histidine phosphatase family protein [Corynebacterium sp. 321]KAB1554230.1 histidine phosphatase family protein [Corynebacterium sp. 319]KAB3528484.1 histidine phosphatase family protein [Corynebacterium sp. 250]KAB3540026.1 histidine phosphatase family protein [Corynebacterium sp. 366]